MDGHDNPGAVNPRDRPRDGNGRFERTIDSAERDAEAARLKSQRWTFQQIADELGYADKSGAYRAVARALAAVPAENVAELRRISLGEIDFLSALMLEILDHEHPHVSQSGKIVTDDDGIRLLDDGPKIAAARELRMLNERRGRIQGSDAPVRSKVEIAGDDDRERELLAQIERLRGGGTGGDGEPAGS